MVDWQSASLALGMKPVYGRGERAKQSGQGRKRRCWHLRGYHRRRSPGHPQTLRRVTFEQTHHAPRVRTDEYRRRSVRSVVMWLTRMESWVSIYILQSATVKGSGSAMSTWGYLTCSKVRQLRRDHGHGVPPPRPRRLTRIDNRRLNEEEERRAGEAGKQALPAFGVDHAELQQPRGGHAVGYLGRALRGGVQPGHEPALGNAVRHHEGTDSQRPLRQAAVEDHPPRGPACSTWAATPSTCSCD